MASIHFDPSYAPCAFLIVPMNGDPRGEGTVLVQNDMDHPGIAQRMGWPACTCLNSDFTDGTIDCPCGKTASDMIASAYEHIREYADVEFEDLDDFLPEVDGKPLIRHSNMKLPRSYNEIGSTAKARIFYPDGRIDEYDDGALALKIYYALPRGVKAAFRAAGDTNFVYPHDFVDS